jgi:hypothetical protein
VVWTEAEILQRGSEAILVGDNGLSLVPDDGHTVAVDLSVLSGDGSVAWVAMWNEFPTVTGDNRRIYAVPTDGSPALRSALPLSSLSYMNRLATSDDGQLAWAMVDDGLETYFLRATPGEGFVTTAQLTREDGTGLAGFAHTGARPNYPVTTDDGSLLYATDLYDVWQVDPAQPVPFGVRAFTDLIWNDEENRGVQYLDMDASGNRWVTAVNFYDADAALTTRMMVTFEPSRGLPRRRSSTSRRMASSGHQTSATTARRLPSWPSPADPLRGFW